MDCNLYGFLWLSLSRPIVTYWNSMWWRLNILTLFLSIDVQLNLVFDITQSSNCCALLKGATNVTPAGHTTLACVCYINGHKHLFHKLCVLLSLQTSKSCFTLTDSARKVLGELLHSLLVVLAWYLNNMQYYMVPRQIPWRNFSAYDTSITLIFNVVALRNNDVSPVVSCLYSHASSDIVVSFHRTSLSHRSYIMPLRWS